MKGVIRRNPQVAPLAPPKEKRGRRTAGESPVAKALAHRAEVPMIREKPKGLIGPMMRGRRGLSLIAHNNPILYNAALAAYVSAAKDGISLVQGSPTVNAEVLVPGQAFAAAIDALIAPGVYTVSEAETLGDLCFSQWTNRGSDSPSTVNFNAVAVAIVALFHDTVGVSALVPADTQACNGVIFRPGGVTAGNVVTTWPEVQAVIDAFDGATNVYIDSSGSAAEVPPGNWNGYGCTSLFPFDTGQGYTLHILDGGTLHDYANMQGVLAICDCTTTPAFAFNPNSAFLLFNFGSIALNAGAVVPAIRITAADVSFTLFARMGSLDNTLAPTVPVITVDATAFLTFYAHTAAYNYPFLTSGNEVGSAVGSTVFWNFDDTVPPLASIYTLGTVDNNPSSQALYMEFDVSAPGNWVGPAPTNPEDAINRIAAVVSAGGATPIP